MPLVYMNTILQAKIRRFNPESINISEHMSKLRLGGLDGNKNFLNFVVAWIQCHKA